MDPEGASRGFMAIELLVEFSKLEESRVAESIAAWKNPGARVVGLLPIRMMKWEGFYA